MTASLYSALAFFVFLNGIVWLWYRRREDRWVRRVARSAVEMRRALYTEIPVLRRLNDGELLEKRRALDAPARAMPGFRVLADYVDVYPPGSRFEKHARDPIRVLVDEAGRTVALIFLAKGSVRVHLATELDGPRWVLTENNRNVTRAVRPPSFDVLRVVVETSPAEMIAAHRERVTSARGDREPSPIRAFDDFVASHERRWDAIRAHRKQVGWALPEEIVLPRKTSPNQRDRILAEVRRLLAET